MLRKTLKCFSQPRLNFVYCSGRCLHRTHKILNVCFGFAVDHFSVYTYLCLSINILQLDVMLMIF